MNYCVGWRFIRVSSVRDADGLREINTNESDAPPVQERGMHCVVDLKPGLYGTPPLGSKFHEIHTPPAVHGQYVCISFYSS